MAADKASRPTSRDEFEIAIVCTRALEYDAICLLFDEFWDTDGDSFGRARGDLNTYTTGCMGKYNIVVVLLCNSGKANAAGAAASLRSSYPCIELLLLTGICDGVPDANGEELLLGDVVISETLIQYDLGTQHVVGFKEKDTLEDRHGRANKNIRNFIANFKTEIGYQRIEEKAAIFLEQIQSRSSETKYQRKRKAATYMYPGSVNDVLFESTHCHRHYNSSQCVCADYNPDEDFYEVCDESRLLDCEQIGCEINSLRARDRLHQKAHLESGGDLKSAQIPSIFLGRFGSGDTAFRSGVHRDSLAKKHNIIAFEMEGAGVWDELPCIIVKGVREYGDGHKAKKWTEWQSFAAATAASVARALVELYPQTDKSPAAALKLAENKACLNALFITNPEDDKQRIEETKGGLLQDVYIWIIRNEQFMQWLDDPETRLLWIKGDPGKGKTMLLCGIINELKTTSPGGNIYYFLCQETDDRLNNASAILRGLLHMMVIKQPSLISYVRHEYNKSGKSAFKGVNSWVVLSRIFEQMLKDDSLKSRRAIFIIDALDECVAGSAQLLKMIVKSSTLSSQAKWLVSSRNEADIQEAMATVENKSTVSLELNAESVSTAIITYIGYKVQLLSDKKGYEQPKRKEIAKYLSDNASGTFLWVALVCALLEKAPRSDPFPKSADYPPGLDQLYERMVCRVCELSVSDISKKVLAIVAVAHRPLTNEELTPLINNAQNEEIMRPIKHDWEDILGHCGSFLTMRSGTIYFVHQSAKDFLVKEGSQRIFPDGMESVHREILDMSIASMRKILRKDMYSLVDPAFSMDNISQPALRDDPLIPIRYGCVYWIDHFEQSISKAIKGTHVSSKSHELIHLFLKEKYIYWLESLSLLRSISDGIARMERLEKLVAKSEATIFESVRDACQFIQTFGNAIADYPLQVYTSALIFSPTSSIVRCQFKEEAPKWIQVLSKSEAEWAPSSRTYESNRRIDELAVSCCGTWIASSHSRADITIWETYSGKIFRHWNTLLPDVLDEHEYRISSPRNTLLPFSPWNKEELVTSTSDSKGHSQLVVWNIITSKASKQLQIKDRVVSIQYLNSGHHILGYLSYYLGQSKKHDRHHDYLIEILVASLWNTKTGQVIKRVQLQEPISRIRLSIFSPTDDSKVAWYRRFNVEIINIDTGRVVHILRNYMWGVANMEFSPDGSILVLQQKNPFWRLSSVFVIRSLNISSGVTQWSFQTNRLAHGLTFSPDGKLLAVATLQGIELLSTDSGKCLRKIMTRSDRLIFSSNGSKIFSAFESVISVVDIGQKGFDAKLNDNSHGKRIIERTLVSLSPNGKIVASAFKNRSVIELMEIDSTNSTRSLRTIELVRHDILKLVFSPDSRKLVVISRGISILWDISSKTSTLIPEYDISFRFDRKYMFSSDSERLATISRSGIYEQVRVWGTGPVSCLMLLEKISIGELDFCFSPDNKRLVISYMKYSHVSFTEYSRALRVEVWDIASVSAVQAIELSRECSFLQHSLGIQEQFLYYVDNCYLVLDILGIANTDSRPTNVRVALRTKMDPEPTGETMKMLRSRKAKIYELDSEQVWIKSYGKRLLWIPSQYRGEIICSERNCVVLPDLGGSFSIIQFCHSELDKQIPPPHTQTSNMGNMPCVSDIETFTYFCELGDDWEIVYRDMNAPDDKMMDKMSGVQSLLVAHRNMEIRYSYWKRRIFGF